MSAVGRHRLLVLADFLERGDLREGKFDMGQWTNVSFCSKLGDCGTSACALGWATQIPAFRRAGLYLDLYGQPTMAGSHHPLEAAQQLFGLTWQDADYLFIPDDDNDLAGKRGRKVVVGRIRKLVARLEKEAS